MIIDAVPIGDNPPRDVNVIIEVSVGGQPIKYEMHKESGTLVVDRFLYTPMSYPGNYGFVPHTLAEDGDPPLDLPEHLQAIHDAVFRCRDITRKLLGFVRQTEVRLERQDLHPVLDDVLDGMLGNELAISKIGRAHV